VKIVEVKDVTYSYDGQSLALKGATFSVEAGSYTCVIGHNGSGKSTIAKLIAGLMPVKSGHIYIYDKEVNVENINFVRENIGIVFQNPDNQFIGSSVEDDIAFGLENKCVDPKEMPAIIDQYSRLVEMQDYLQREPENLSGGQKQRVAIAGVLAMKPNILIFDEATSMLDPLGKQSIKEIIRSLKKEHNLTIISITHDIEEAYLCDHVVVMNEGKVAFQGKPEEVFKREKELKAMRLDIPFVEYARNQFKAQGITLNARDVEGMVTELWRLSSKA